MPWKMKQQTKKKGTGQRNVVLTLEMSQDDNRVAGPERNLSPLEEKDSGLWRGMGGGEWDRLIIWKINVTVI